MSNRIRHTRPSCCHSRLGKAKKTWPTRAAAEKAIQRGRKKYGDEPMEVYPCQVQPNRWHVRKKREKKEQVNA